MLEALGRIANILSSKRFRPLHNAIRVTVGRSLPAILQSACGYRWRLRHSSTSRDEYHFLYSDFDFALILPLDAKPEDASAAIGKYQSLRSRLRFLGELEVYFEHEWNEKLRLESRHPELLNMVRGFRKQHWMDLEKAKYTDSYHLAKADRAQRKIEQELGNLDELLTKFLTPQQLVWLEFLALNRAEYIPFYDRSLPDSLPHAAAAFFKVVAVGMQDEKLLTRHPLFFERQIVHKHELLCYSAYFRASKGEVHTCNDWMKKLSSNLDLPLSQRPQPRALSRYSLAQIGEGTIVPEQAIFEVELDLTRRIECYLNENFKDLPPEDVIQREYEALRQATAIITLHNYFALWLQSLYPQWLVKLRVEGGAQKNFQSLVRSGSHSNRSPQPRTVSLISPLANRYGLLQLNNIVEAIERKLAADLTVELTHHEPNLDEDEIADFFRYSAKARAEFVFSDEPSGVVILPTLYNLPADEKWLELAVQTGLPVVAGYGDNFEARVLDAMATGRSSIQMDFPYLKDEILAPH